MTSDRKDKNKVAWERIIKPLILDWRCEVRLLWENSVWAQTTGWEGSRILLSDKEWLTSCSPGWVGSPSWVDSLTLLHIGLSLSSTLAVLGKFSGVRDIGERGRVIGHSAIGSTAADYNASFVVRLKKLLIDLWYIIIFSEQKKLALLMKSSCLSSNIVWLTHLLLEMEKNICSSWKEEKVSVWMSCS